MISQGGSYRRAACSLQIRVPITANQQHTYAKCRTWGQTLPIKAHASVCFIALILYRVMRQRLKLAGSELSPEAALADLRRIQRHTVRIDSGAPIRGVSTVHPRQADVLAALNIKKPTYDAQLPLL